MTATSTHTELEPHLHVLPNGLTVAMEQLPYLHSATISVWIRTGSANEAKEHAGVSHFLEHLFFKGTESRTARELMEAIESRGGHMNAFTSREYTCLYVKCLKAHVAISIEVLGDIVKRSTFTDMDKERHVILEEIASAIDVPEDYAHDLLTERVWPGHALGRPIAGYHDTVSAISLEDVRAYMDTQYLPRNMVVAVAGNFDEGAVLKQLEDEFGPLAAGAPENGFDSAEFSPGADWVDRPIAQNHVSFAFPALSITDERRYVYDLLSNVLGGGSTSRLFERIREDEGLAYSIYSFHQGYRKNGMLGVYAAIAPENFQKTVTLCSEELRKLRDGPVPADELAGNKEQLKGGLLLALESTFNRVGRMARSLMYFGRVLTVEEILESVDAVSTAQIQSLAQSLFTPDGYAMAVLGPRNQGVPALFLAE